jgi:thioredoxin-dependent peroxiredoxin
MRHRLVVAAFAAALASAVVPQTLLAQEAPAEMGPKVGDVAPDFALAGATRYGLLKNPVRLSDYKGETVVLAFFFKARTRG